MDSNKPKQTNKISNIHREGSRPNAHKAICCSGVTHCPEHIHMCKNNKRKRLVKGVGGEAARQKDINSPSEFNKRDGRERRGRGERPLEGGEESDRREL